MKFEKVSFETFARAVEQALGDRHMDEAGLRKLYCAIRLPERSTPGSAGYDFFSPIPAVLYPLSLRISQAADFESGSTASIPVAVSRCEVLIPTGIKAKIDPGWVLTLHPRSGQGFRYGISLANTTGIIDEDYYNNETNEGHIMVKLTTTSTDFESFRLAESSAFCQGIFLPYGLTDDDSASAKKARTGGLGSTGGA